MKSSLKESCKPADTKNQSINGTNSKKHSETEIKQTEKPNRILPLVDSLSDNESTFIEKRDGSSNFFNILDALSQENKPQRSSKSRIDFLCDDLMSFSQFEAKEENHLFDFPITYVDSIYYESESNPNIICKTAIDTKASNFTSFRDKNNQKQSNGTNKKK